MFLVVCLLLWDLYLVQMEYIDFQDINFVPKMTSNGECDYYYLSIVKEFQKNTRIMPGDRVSYCLETQAEFKRRYKWQHLTSDMSEVINFYKSLEHVILYDNALSPVTSVGVIQGYSETIPVYVLADISYKHLRPARAHSSSTNRQAQMELMGKLESDRGEYLLNPSMGGREIKWNFAPFAASIFKKGDCLDPKNILSPPSSYWKCHEKWITSFLGLYKYGRVAWRLVLHYHGTIVLDPENYKTFRPDSFSIQYTAYTDWNDTDTMYYESPEMTYLNDNDYPCGYHEDVDSVPTVKTNSTEIFSKDCHVGVPTKPRGQVGGETHFGEWTTRYRVAFPFTINEKVYFYGHSVLDGQHWFIQELLPNGKMGFETDNGRWDDYYEVAFPYVINGVHYFYSHSLSKKDWFIQELRPGGRMGHRRTRGTWKSRYFTAFPFTIGGKYYFFGHSAIDGTHWFIQELLADGQMGRETDCGVWKYSYHVSFPFMINGRVFFYSHSTSEHNWFIQELLPDGKMGAETSHGSWDKRYDASLTFTKGSKHYMYAQTIIDNNQWFIRELLPGGRMGSMTDSGRWKDNYLQVFPFSVDGRQYFYGHSIETYEWTIHELL